MKVNYLKFPEHNISSDNPQTESWNRESSLLQKKIDKLNMNITLHVYLLREMLCTIGVGMTFVGSALCCCLKCWWPFSVVILLTLFLLHTSYTL